MSPVRVPHLATLIIESKQSDNKRHVTLRAALKAAPKLTTEPDHMTRYAQTFPQNHSRRPARCKVIKRLDAQSNAGNMNGGIFLVRDTRTGQTFLEKRFQPESIRDDRSFKREFDVMELIDSKGSQVIIVKLEDWYLNKEKGIGGIVMEYFKLGSMGALTDRHRRANIRMVGKYAVWTVVCAIGEYVAVLSLWGQAEGCGEEEGIECGISSR